MKIIRMRRSGRRLEVSDRKAALLVRIGAATEEPPVVKKPLPQEAIEPATPAEVEEISEKQQEKKPTRRRYRRRDMEAEG